MQAYVKWEGFAADSLTQTERLSPPFFYWYSVLAY